MNAQNVFVIALFAGLPLIVAAAVLLRRFFQRRAGCVSVSDFASIQNAVSQDTRLVAQELDDTLLALVAQSRAQLQSVCAAGTEVSLSKFQPLLQRCVVQLAAVEERLPLLAQQLHLPENQGLNQVLGRYFRAIQDVHPVTVVFHCPADCQLSQPFRRHLLALVKGLVDLSLRRSGATLIQLHVAGNEGWLDVQYSDNGGLLVSPEYTSFVQAYNRLLKGKPCAAPQPAPGLQYSFRFSLPKHTAGERLVPARGKLMMFSGAVGH